MKIIETEGMPQSNGHYSQCIEHGGLLYLSGQLPIEIGTRKIPDTIEDQARLALKNVATVLKEAGSAMDKIISMRVYITDISLWDTVNEIYCEVFGAHKPTRCIVPTRELHFGCNIEVEAIAISN